MSRKYLPICHSELVSESTDTMKVKDSDPSADGRNDKKDLFRLDSLILKNLSNKDKLILSCGGEVIINNENIESTPKSR